MPEDEKTVKAPIKEAPRGDVSDRLLARQLGRLIEDFVECDEESRFEITALAQELAEARLRKAERTSIKPPSA